MKEQSPMQGILFMLVGIAAFSITVAAQSHPSGTAYPYKRMADGKQWTTQNLNVNTPESYCYGDSH